MKRCSRCKLTKPLDEFHNDKRKADGRAQYCKPCQKLAAREHYLRHADRVKSRAREYRNENIETVRKREMEYQEAHREEARERTRKWMQENHERALENKRRYRQDRPDIWKKNNHLRRARKKGAQVLGDVDFDAILARDKGICWLCGKNVNPDEVSFDHVIPLAKGGEHSERNLRVAHLHCNLSKKDRLVSHQMYLL